MSYYPLPPGIIHPFAGSTGTPLGWLVCDGSAVSRVTYSALFAAISTTYGVGDGGTTFNLPDLRQRFPLGKAASGTGATLGEAGGAIDHSHTVASHSHTVTDHVHTGTGHTHGIGSDGAHTHGGSTSDGSNSNADFAGGLAAAASLSGHTHTIATDSQGAHNHGGGTGSAGAVNTSTIVGGAPASGSAAPATNAANPAYLTLYMIIKT